MIFFGRKSIVVSPSSPTASDMVSDPWLGVRYVPWFQSEAESEIISQTQLSNHKYIGFFSQVLIITLKIKLTNMLFQKINILLPLYDLSLATEVTDCAIPGIA